jgi:hypothetical protein
LFFKNLFSSRADPLEAEVPVQDGLAGPTKHYAKQVNSASMRQSVSASVDGEMSALHRLE